jgi:hypothetical protein
MASKADIEAYLIRTGVVYEEIEDGMWVIGGQEAHSADVVVRVDEPIVVFRMNVMKVPNQKAEEFLRKLLELNATQMLHAFFGLEDDVVVLGGAQQLENLDFNEFQAMLDDLYMAVGNHFKSLKELKEAVGQ